MFDVMLRSDSKNPKIVYDFCLIFQFYFGFDTCTLISRESLTIYYHRSHRRLDT